MKKFIILFLISLFLVTPKVSSQEDSEETTPAATKVASPTETPDDSLSKTPTDKIKELKDRVANRVAELKKERLNGMSGALKSSTDAAFIITSNNNDYSIQLDEEGKVYTVDSFLRKKEVKLSSFEKNTLLTVIGTINNEEKSAVAEVVVSRAAVKQIIGTVTAVSSKDGTISVKGTDGKDYIIDIEVTTKVNVYDKDKDLISKIGMSKIETGSLIHVYATPEEKEDRLTGIRILILPKNLTTAVTETVSPTAAATPTVTPKVKTTPKASPSPTKVEEG